MKAEQPQLRTGIKWEVKSLPIFFPQSKIDSIKKEKHSQKKKNFLSYLESSDQNSLSCMCIILKAYYLLHTQFCMFPHVHSPLALHILWCF